MDVDLLNDDLSNSTGEILASWFIANPNGPTAFAIGYTEIEDKRRLFYRWMHFTGGCTWLLNSIPEELELWDGEFDHILINSILNANTFFVASGSEHSFLASIPQIVLTNGNIKLSAAFFEFLQIGLAQCDWGKELYYIEKYGSNLFKRYEEEFRDIFEKLKKDQNISQEAITVFWDMHSHRKGFKNWIPNQYQSSYVTDAFFNRWKAIVTNRSYVFNSLYNFCQMWVGSYETAKYNGLLNKLGEKAECLTHILNFFEEYNMPLAPKEIDESYIKKQMGLG